MSVFLIKYKKKGKSGHKITRVKWRVQIRTKNLKIDRVFNEEITARQFDKAIRERGENQVPTVRQLLSNYFQATQFKLAHSTTAANRNRCLSVIPSACIVSQPSAGLQPKQFGDLKICDVTYLDVIAYIEMRRTLKIKENTILRELSTISAAYEKIYKIYPTIKGLINPVKSLPKDEKPRQKLNRMRILSASEDQAISSILKSKKNKEPYYLYVMCLQSAARKSEVLSITSGDIDFQKWFAYLPTTKNGRPRSILIPSDNCVRTWLKSKKSQPGKVFSLTPSNFRYYWVAALRKIGIYDCADRPVFHDTRRTAITRLINQKSSNLFQIARNVGASPQTIERERQTMPNMLSHLFEKLRRGEALTEHEIMQLVGHNSISMTNAYFGR